MTIVKKFLSLIILLLLSYWAVAPFFHNGFFPMHDDAQVQRVFEMKQALADGMFPVRWVKDLGYGYGYPIFNFYAPFAYSVGGFINLIGFNALLATKIMMALGIILSGVFMYLLAREFWGEIGGLVSGLLYVYAPYHAVDIYVRGDAAEFWAYAFIPLAFLGVYKLYCHCERIAKQSPTKAKTGRGLPQPFHGFAMTSWFWLSIGSIGYAGIILSHNLTAMMVTPFLFVALLLLFLVLLFNGRRKSYFVLLVLLIGILLSAFYWLPALMEMKYTNVLSQIGGGADYHDHFVCLSQLWNSPWGFGGSVPGCLSDGLSFKIGKLHSILSLLSLIALVIIWKKEKIKAGVILFSIVSLLFAIFLMLQQSQFIWDAIPQMAFFQYPWRFLVLASFFTSFLSGASIWIVSFCIELLFRATNESRNLLPQKLLRGMRSLRSPTGSVGMTNNNEKKLFAWDEMLKWPVYALFIYFIIFFNAKVFVPQLYLQKTSVDYTSQYSLTWTTSRISDEYMPKGFAIPKNPGQVPKTKIVTQNTSAKLLSFSQRTQRMTAKISTDKQTRLLVNLAYFPAWHIFIDGKQVVFTNFNRGLLVTIPKGEHILDIRFSQTPIERVADAISIAGILCLIIVIIFERRAIRER